MPASLTKIHEEDPFTLLMNLENLNVDKNNPKYASVDGILFNKNIEELVHFPAAKKLTVYYMPKTVKIIKKQSLLVQHTLTTIIFQNTITDVEFTELKFAIGIRSLIFPLGVSIPGQVLDKLNIYNISYYSLIIKTCPIVYNNAYFNLYLLSHFMIYIS